MSDTATVSQIETKLKEPSMYKIIFHNDDYTPMFFVVALLVQIFDKTMVEANELTLQVHKTGRGVVGTYTFEIAKQKVIEATYASQSQEHPLKITMEKA
jgi:ATP-dependent Clp protease adaptor protein ClpS